MGILDSATSQTVDQIQAPGHAAGRVMSRGCAASEPASPPATTWGSEAAAAAGGTQARRLAARPSHCSRGAGGSRGARRADLGFFLTRSCKDRKSNEKKDNLNHLWTYAEGSPALNESAAANEQAHAGLGGGALRLPATTTTTRRADGGGA
ncbi:PREDICTED: gem-associated protein 7 isoform X1 [Hipposideros armiger]|uniref:Gem-associated protein 7 isoform X1 n=1 Tax=Hipposideros armiger TaxID=186990 RepID=A0A8B7PZD5_HIPAR|nr:PREDICTED: gem-associated protein 7 isoform X1 [Hipposideros armiger]